MSELNWVHWILFVMIVCALMLFVHLTLTKVTISDNKIIKPCGFINDTPSYLCKDCEFNPVNRRENKNG